MTKLTFESSKSEKGAFTIIFLFTQSVPKEGFQNGILEIMWLTHAFLSLLKFGLMVLFCKANTRIHLIDLTGPSPPVNKIHRTPLPLRWGHHLCSLPNLIHKILELKEWKYTQNPRYEPYVQSSQNFLNKTYTQTSSLFYFY